MNRKLKIFGGAAAVLAAGVVASSVIPLADGPSHAYAQQAVTAQEARQDLLIGAERLSDAFRAAAKVLKPSVVTITAKVEQPVQRLRRGQPGRGFDLPPQFRGLPLEEFFGDFDDSIPQPEERLNNEQSPNKSGPTRTVKIGVGSGVIVSPDGYIITNNHVVREADQLQVQLSDGRSFSAKIKGTDESCDLALLKIEATGLVPAALGDSTRMEVGDWVIAVGSPFELEQTVTAGIISAVNRSMRDFEELKYQDFLQTDAAINPGNSGGPLVNLRGEVIGINTAINSRTGTNAGVGFAIPSNTAAWVMNDLRELGRVRRGFIGARLDDVEYDELRNENLPPQITDGVRIAGVYENGPAAKAKLVEGDIVTKANGRVINSVESLRNVVAMVRPGQSVDFELYRKGKPLQLRVTVEEQTEEKLAAMSGRSEVKDLGIAVETVTPQVLDQLDIDAEVGGVVVTEIDRRGKAFALGMQPGDIITQVNGADVSTPPDLIKAVESRPDRLMFVVRRGNTEIVLRINSRR